MDNERHSKDSSRLIGPSIPFFRNMVRTERSLAFDVTKPPLAERRVLIVSDDVENGWRAFVSLIQAGARARLVRRQDELAIYLDEIRPDIVVIDCDSAPGGNTAIVGQLRRDSRTSAAALVALSRYASSGQRASLLAAGADKLLPKPIDARLFAQQLVETLSLSGARR
jgi:DNA-binding response OmpR family regulator